MDVPSGRFDDRFADPRRAPAYALNWTFARERVTGIEHAFLAWEADPTV